MSLSCQMENWGSLSPESSWPLAVPRLMSARSRKATELELLLIVTVVDLSAPAGPDWVVVTDVAEMAGCGIAGRGGSPVRSAHWEHVAGGTPRALLRSPPPSWW